MVLKNSINKQRAQSLKLCGSPDFKKTVKILLRKKRSPQIAEITDNRNLI